MLYCATEAIQKPPGEGWRVEVNLRMGRYRWVRRYGRKLERTPYRPLAELPGDRIERARRESARQRALKGR